MPLPANKTASELGFKVGDRFRVVDGSHTAFVDGSTIELVRDDDTDEPEFVTLDGKKERDYTLFCKLEPLTTPKPKKTTITRIDTTIYSDDVRIEWGNKDLIFIDGLGKTREEWTKYWSRIGNVLRRKR